MASIVISLLGVLLSVVHRTQADTLPWPVSIDTDTPKFVVNELYLSYGMDSNLIRDRWETFDFYSARVKTLAKALGPAYLRLMGTDGDKMEFSIKDRNKTAKLKSWPFPSTQFVMTGEDWDNINRFAAQVGWKIVFGVNAQMRQAFSNTTSVWNPENAMLLLKYSISQGYAANLHFEFGNEPDLYNKPEDILTPEKLALEFDLFRQLLNKVYGKYFSKALLIGPDIAVYTDFLAGFLQNVGKNTIDAVSWHHYYGGGELRYIQNYTDSKLLDSYRARAEVILSTVKKSPLNGVKIWQGETSSTYSPPDSDIDETYVAGFMLLDKLGVSAMLGIDVVIRQTFYGFWFALIDENLMPRPNYWTALLFHRLVGNKVLNLTNVYQNSEVRLYAHCTSPDSTYPAGTVVVYGMNLLPFNLVLQFPRQSEISVDAYLLSPPSNDLTSAGILLNGVPVVMKDDYSLPELPPLTLKQGEGPSLPIKQYGFFVLKGFKAKACM